MNLRRTIRIASFIILLIAIVWFITTRLAWDKANNEGGIGTRFHKDTSLSWLGVIKEVMALGPKKPPPYKSYKGAKMIRLPKPGFKGISLEDAIERRRSVRNYSKRGIDLSRLSRLLHAAQGITGRTFGTGLRSAPSAGALYPFEIYCVINNVEGLDKGIYHYSVRKHGMELVKSGDFRQDITVAGLRQEMLGESAVTFALAAVFARITSKYGERGYRYVYMEAGHISQNIYLQATSLGLVSVSVGAFFDEKVNELIGLDGEKEAVIYLHAVGVPK